MAIPEKVLEMVGRMDKRYRDEIIEMYNNCEQIRIQRGLGENYCENYIIEKVKSYLSNLEIPLKIIIDEEMRNCIQTYKFYYPNMSDPLIENICKKRIMEKYVKKE